MIILSEESRRMQDMMKQYGAMGMDASMFPSDETLVLNRNNALVNYTIEHLEGDEEKIETDRHGHLVPDHEGDFLSSQFRRCLSNTPCDALTTLHGNGYATSTSENRV